MGTSGPTAKIVHFDHGHFDTSNAANHTKNPVHHYDVHTQFPVSRGIAFGNTRMEFLYSETGSAFFTRLVNWAIYFFVRLKRIERGNYEDPQELVYILLRGADSHSKVYNPFENIDTCQSA